MHSRPLIRLPWENLTPEEFEQLCYHLLIAMEFTDVEWFRGPGDRGRDILATGTGTDLSAFGSRQRCVIECKRFAAGHTVSIEDLTRTVAWMDAREEYQRLIIMTTSHLRTDTRDWVFSLNRRRTHYKIAYIESHELFQHLIRHQDILCRFFPDYNMAKITHSRAYEEYITRLSSIWRGTSCPSEAITLSRSAFREFRKAVGVVDDVRIGLIFTEQMHLVRYSKRGISDIDLQISMANVSDSPIAGDTITLYSHKPLIHSHWRYLGLEVIGSTKPIPRARVFSELLPHVIRADYTFPEALPPGETAVVKCKARIRHRTPLAGRRGWSALIHRFTVDLVLNIFLPDGYYASDAEVTHRVGNVRTSVHAWPSSPTSDLKYSERCPTVSGEVSLEFIAHR